MLNIIGDLEGRINTLKALIKKMPQGRVLCVGDIIDRGPSSKAVIEWLMVNGDSLMGNHEHQFIMANESSDFYDPGLWEFYNGGLATLKCYNPDMKDWTPEGYDSIKKSPTERDLEVFKSMHKNVPKEHIEWLKTRPLYYQEPGLIVTHGSLFPRMELSKALDIGFGFKKGSPTNTCVLWNISEPRHRPGIIQIFGHHAQYQVRFYNNTFQKGTYNQLACASPWAIDVDSSKSKFLSGIHWPTMEIFTQEYLD